MFRSASPSSPSFFLPRLLGVVLLQMSLGLTALQAEERPAVRIGVSGPFTGGSGPMGESMRNGIRLAVHEINHVGGVLGRRIELVERDDQANPEVGGRIAKELLDQEKVVATVGIVNTGVALASIDHYQKARVPLVIAVSTGPSLTRRYAPPAAKENYIFRLSPSLALEAAALCEDMRKRRLKKVALLADGTPYGDAAVGAVSKAVAAARLDLVAVERFAIGDTDMAGQLQRARAAGAQALILWGIGPEMAAVAKGRATLGWNVPLFGGWTLSMKNFIDGAGEAGEGAMMTQTFIQDDGGSQVKSGFLLAYQSMFRQSVIPSPMSAAQGYDAMYLLVAAMRKAKSFSGPDIRAALETLDKRINGVLTSYERPFTREDHEAITGNMLVMGQVKAGRVVYAYPDDARRHAIVRKLTATQALPLLAQ